MPMCLMSLDLITVIDQARPVHRGGGFKGVLMNPLAPFSGSTPTMKTANFMPTKVSSPTVVYMYIYSMVHTCTCMSKLSDDKGLKISTLQSNCLLRKNPHC